MHSPPTGVENLAYHMAINQAALIRYVDALQADTYKVQLKNRSTEEGFWVSYSPTQLLNAGPYLRRKNAHGFDIYARPIGYQYILLDDLTRLVLADVATVKPCLLLETSPNNYQAWLILSEVPADRDTAKAICQQVAQQFNADPASAEPDHVGRLPGFTNRKPKYQLATGNYPFVILHRAEYRYSSFHPRGGAVLYAPTVTHQQLSVNHRSSSIKDSVSEQDFGVACGLLRIGKTDEEIYQYLLATSPNLAYRKGKHVDYYLRRTITSARRLPNGY